jgi:hypothetical protein
LDGHHRLSYGHAPIAARTATCHHRRRQLGRSSGSPLSIRLGVPLLAPKISSGCSSSNRHWWREDIQSRLVRGIGPVSPTETDD